MVFFKKKNLVTYIFQNLNHFFLSSRAREDQFSLYIITSGHLLHFLFNQFIHSFQGTKIFFAFNFKNVVYENVPRYVKKKCSFYMRYPIQQEIQVANRLFTGVTIISAVPAAL